MKKTLLLTIIFLIAIAVSFAQEININQNYTICLGESQELTVQVTGGTPPYTYDWSTGENTQSITVSPEETTVYAIVVTDNLSNSISAEVTVRVVTCNYFTDSRDGNIYRSVTIGNQEWMAENLKYLPEVNAVDTYSLETPHYYVINYDGTDINQAKATTDYQTYGVLYNWAAALNACPEGWHLPSIEEWRELSDFVGGDDIAGNFLKSTTNWGENWNGIDTYGFKAIPGGYVSSGIFVNYGSMGSWWSSTKIEGLESWSLYTSNWANSLSNINSFISCGESIRCVKDALTISMNEPGFICQGESIELTVDLKYGIEPYTYEWSTGEATESITVSPQETTTYTITVTDAEEQTATAEIKVRVVNCGFTQDLRDNNIYHTVTIGNQKWMVQNLKYLPSVVNPETGSNTEPYHYVYGYNGADEHEAKATENYQTYGVLYNWQAAMNACPDGWHLPSDEDWSELLLFVENDGYFELAGHALKDTSGWVYEGNGINAYGFAAYGGGVRSSNALFYSLTYIGYWWTASEINEVSALSYQISYDNHSLDKNTNNKQLGYSVRCLQHIAPLTISIPPQGAICLGESTTLTVEIESGNAPYTYEWSTGEAIESITVTPEETTIYTVTVTDAENQTATVEVTVYVVQCGVIEDTRDGNTYRTVKIGNQEWMAENLKYLPEVIYPETSSDIAPYYYVYEFYGEDVSEAFEIEEYQLYGVLYNWAAAMNACPEGWYLPSDEEWAELTTFIENNGHIEHVGYALKSTSGWLNDGNGSDEYGFTALAGGSVENNEFSGIIGGSGNWWSSSEGGSSTANYRGMSDGYDGIGSGYNDKAFGFSVRCIRNVDPLHISIPHRATICSGESITLTVEIESGNSPYTYEWSTEQTTESIIVTPQETIIYTITVTDAFNQTIQKEITITVVACGVIEDSRDGNTYRTVIIGEQEWMAENLKFSPSVIGQETGSNTEPYYYVYGYNGTDVNEAKATENYQIYGVLYNWEAAMSACPEGWHLPSNEEWTILADYVGGFPVAGEKLKSTSGWLNDGNGSDEYGFTALAGGGKDNGMFSGIQSSGNWWTSSDYNVTGAYSVGMSDYYNGIGFSELEENTKRFGASVRCVKDSEPIPTIEIIKQIPDQTIQINTPSERFIFADYFSYSGTDSVLYYVYAYSYNEDDLFYIAQDETSFGFLGLKQESFYVYVYAEIESTEIYEYLSFVVTVESPISHECEPFTITPTISDVSCHGGTDGSISIDVSGGTPPYSYRWSNTRTDNKITRVPSGGYSVMVIDSLLCVSREFFYINQPTRITIHDSKIPPACGVADGEILVSATGGNAPYTYRWNTGASTTLLQDITAGVYTVTATDNAGCITRKTFELQNDNAPTVTIQEVTSTACNPNNGTIQLGVSGGTAPYSFLWNDDVNTQNRTELAAGTYSIVVTDNDGCKVSRIVEVPAKAIIQPEIALVTYSVMTGNNLVVWLREQTDAIDYYSIYKEIDGSGNFELIDIQRYDTISVFEDTRTNPLEESARYRISATDFCGNESHMSAALAEYKTMNLVLEITPQVIELHWDAYEGAEYYRYLIYARNKQGEWTQIAITPATALQYSVANNGTYTAFYVAVELQRQIAPLSEYLKAESGPFTLAMSNIAEAETETLIAEIKTSESIQIYPSVVSDKISVVIPQQYASARISITTVLGNEVLRITSKEPYTQIPIETLTDGTYIVTVTTDTVQKSVVVVKK